MDENKQKSLLPGLAIVGTNLSGVGCAIPILVVVAIFAGRELDRWLGTKPWILLLMLFGSVASGLGMMIYSALSAAQAAHRQYLQRTGERDSRSGTRSNNEE